MPDVPVFELHITRAARERYRCADSLFTLTGNALFANLAATRELAARMTEARSPEHAIHPGALYAMGLIDEALHAVIGLYRERRDPNALSDALAWFERRLGRDALDQTLARFVSEFPPLVVHRGEQAPDTWLATTTGTEEKQPRGSGRFQKIGRGQQIVMAHAAMHGTALDCCGAATRKTDTGNDAGAFLRENNRARYQNERGQD